MVSCVCAREAGPRGSCGPAQKAQQSAPVCAAILSAPCLRYLFRRL